MILFPTKNKLKSIKATGSIFPIDSLLNIINPLKLDSQYQLRLYSIKCFNLILQNDNTHTHTQNFY